MTGEFTGNGIEGEVAEFTRIVSFTKPIVSDPGTGLDCWLLTKKGKQKRNAIICRGFMIRCFYTSCLLMDVIRSLLHKLYATGFLQDVNVSYKRPKKYLKNIL